MAEVGDWPKAVVSNPGTPAAAAQQRDDPGPKLWIAERLDHVFSFRGAVRADPGRDRRCLKSARFLLVVMKRFVKTTGRFGSVWASNKS